MSEEETQFIDEPWIRLQVFKVLMSNETIARGPKEVLYPFLNQNVDWVLGKYKGDGTDKEKS